MNARWYLLLFLAPQAPITTTLNGFFLVRKFNFFFLCCKFLFRNTMFLNRQYTSELIFTCKCMFFPLKKWCKNSFHATIQHLIQNIWSDFVRTQNQSKIIKLSTYTFWVIFKVLRNIINCWSNNPKNLI